MKKFLVLLLVPFILIACGEDNPTNNPEDLTDNLFPLIMNNYWLFDKITLDSVNKPDSNVPATKDSAFIAGTDIKLSRQASILRHIRKVGTGNSFPDQFYYMENSKIYAHSDIITNFTGYDDLDVELPLKFDEQWFLMIDPKAESWKIAEQSFEDDTLVIAQGTYVIFSGKLTLNGRKSGTTNITIKGKSHKAHIFDLNLALDANTVIVVGTNATPPQKMKFDRDITFWFVNNIGLVKHKLESIAYSVPFVGFQKFPGYESTIYDYLVTDSK